MPQITVQHNPGDIEGLAIITPEVHGDARGYLIESYNEREMAECGIDVCFVQDNQSVSKKGALRGLHFQKNYPQAKLIHAASGSFFDVAVDLRKNSPTFGKSFGLILSQKNNIHFYIPAGFAHGFLVLEDNTVFLAKVSDYQHKGDASGLAWNDPDVNIKWPMDLLGGTELIIGERDKNRPSLIEIKRQMTD